MAMLRVVLYSVLVVIGTNAIREEIQHPGTPPPYVSPPVPYPNLLLAAGGSDLAAPAAAAAPADPGAQPIARADPVALAVPQAPNVVTDADDEGWVYENKTVADTRRILHSKKVLPGKRPYMVYLQLTKDSAKVHKYKGWLCGGVIIHASYVLTSAACVEDADRFYIVSGTTKYVDSSEYKSNDCVCKNRRRVIWKCIPKNYKFDFQDSIKWSSNDIAIVKVNRKFKFNKVEKGCEFAAAPLLYNNVSRELETSGTKGFIAGWGSVGKFREGVYRRQSGYEPINSKTLQEAKVCVMDNEQCSKKWAQKFRSIIQQYMICTKDVMKLPSEICDKRYANCTELDDTRRQNDPGNLTDPELNSIKVDLGRHLKQPDDVTARRSTGGFCENDHGGPLIVKFENKERVIGVISACKIDPKSHSCHGPFLYTSVFKNRQFISCSVNKDVEENCRRVFRTGITHEEYNVDWEGVDDDESDKGEDSEEALPVKEAAAKGDSSKEESDNEENEKPKPKKAKKNKNKSKAEKKKKASVEDEEDSE